jgi:hypothetical protein
LEDTSNEVGGHASAATRLRGLCAQGRCLAAKGHPDEAEAALNSAANGFGTLGLYLHEVLCLRDLLCNVLKTTGREVEGIARLKTAIVRLIGADPERRELDLLAASLGTTVDLAAILQ